MSGFEYFMVANKIGGNRKLRRLTPAQRWAYVAGVLALASQSPIRGALLITDGEPVTAQDIADEATVKLADALALLAALRRFGMLHKDADGIEWVHDWDAINKDPKPSDSPEARRERKRAQRAKQRGGHADVTRPESQHVTRDIEESHTPEGEGEVNNNPPGPPLREGSDLPPVKPSGKRKTDLDTFTADMQDWSDHHFPGAELGAVAAAVDWMRSRDGSAAVTAGTVRDFAASSDVWAAQLGLTEPATRGEAA